MDFNELCNVLKRKPHIEISRFLRPNDIINAVYENHPEYSEEERKNAKEKINAAIILATSAHQGILRKSGEPYIVHPYSVAYFLAKMGLDLECVISGLLHDTVEDTTTTLLEIENLFGTKASKLVDGVTKLTNLNINKAEKQAHAFKKLITFAADDIRVIFIKLLDRLHNMMTLDSMPPERQKAIADETIRFYAPLAHRLGIYWLKEELEALSFFYTNNDDWNVINNYIDQKYENPELILNLLQDKVRDAINFKSPIMCNKISSIYGRIKSYCSIYKKTIKQERSISSLYDIIGIRVIIESDNLDDCYAVMGAIHSSPDFTVISERFKDYIATPKANRYMSIHTGVRYKEYFMEIQIRTIGMHHIAEEGDASHWAYKNDESHKDKTTKWLKEVLSDFTDSNNPLSFMRDIETALPLEKISIFTPKGELVTLPEGATLLDFAYAIHGMLGNTCIGGTVNGKKVPIYYKLNNKDEASVESSKKQVPRSDWLNFVVTHKAKHYINRHLKKQEKSVYIAKGKEKLKPLFDALHRQKDFENITSLHLFSEIEDKYSLPKVKTEEVFFLKIATGEIKLRKLIQTFFSDSEIEKLIALFPNRIAPLFPERRKEKEKDEAESKPGNHSIFIQSLGEIKDYHIAKCCNPEEGDPIAAYISPNRGYIIHNSKCQTIETLEPERIERNVYWYAYNMYLIEFIIEIKNNKGAILEVIQEIVNYDLNINSMHIDPKDTTEKSGLLYMTVKGSDIKKIEKLEQTLKQKKNIISLMIGNIENL